jgi:phage-related holin
MAFTAKPLADGTLPTTQAAIYTVPAVTVAYVKQLFLFNTNAVVQVITLWLNTSGTVRKWRTLTLAQNESADILEQGESLQLEAGDVILAEGTTASATDYVLTGVTEQ